MKACNGSKTAQNLRIDQYMKKICFLPLKRLKSVFCCPLVESVKPVSPSTPASITVGCGWVPSYSFHHTIPLSHRVIDVKGSIPIASSDVISKQRVPSAVCISRSDSGHRGVYGGAFTHTGVVGQVQEDWVVVVDVSDTDPHHHLRTTHQDRNNTSNSYLNCLSINLLEM